MALDQNTLILFIVGIVALYILIRVASRVMKVIAIVLIAGLFWYFYQGNSIDDLKGDALGFLIGNAKIEDYPTKFCAESKKDNFRCACIAQPVYLDLKSRLSDAQIADLENDKEAKMVEIKQSILNRQEEIKACGGEKNKVLTDKIMAFVKGAGNSVKKGLENANGKKEE
ncbi:MAG: hypothetical protein ACJAWV_001341 [Flammeovirgaceae bacterium]|jgi:hypothetical protein